VEQHQQLVEAKLALLVCVIAMEVGQQVVHLQATQVTGLSRMGGEAPATYPVPELLTKRGVRLDLEQSRRQAPWTSHLAWAQVRCQASSEVHHPLVVKLAITVTVK
jgi:hypothetical protein